jgi:hypothetical protein
MYVSRANVDVCIVSNGEAQYVEYPVFQIMFADLVNYFRVFSLSVISNNAEGQVLGCIAYMSQTFFLF